MAGDEKSRSELIGEELAKPGMRARLHGYAKWFSRDRHEAEDLVSEALLRVLDEGDSPWDGSRSFFSHMARLLRQGWDRRRQRHGFSRVSVDTSAVEERAPGEAPLADSEVDRLRDLAIKRELALQVLAELPEDDRIARALFDQAQSEELTVPELARLLNSSDAEIVAAQRRLAYHGKLVLERWRRAEASRMAALRQASMSTQQEETP